MNSFLKNPKVKWQFWWGVLVFFIFIWVISLRFLILDYATGVHYHADFQIYIQGEPLLLDNPSYYEEDTACNVGNQTHPTSRVHLHDQIPHVIHIHDEAATYSHLMSNLGFNLSNKVLQTRDKINIDQQGGRLRFILNGQPVFDIANKVIRNEDVLLIDFSNDNLDVLKERYNNIERGAAEANLSQDPAGCATSSSSSKSHWQRLKDVFSF